MVSVRGSRPAMRLALAVVDHHGEDVVERLAVLLLQMRVGDGEQQQRVAPARADTAPRRARHKSSANSTTPTPASAHSTGQDTKGMNSIDQLMAPY